MWHGELDDSQDRNVSVICPVQCPFLVSRNYGCILSQSLFYHGTLSTAKLLHCMSFCLRGNSLHMYAPMKINNIKSKVSRHGSAYTAPPKSASRLISNTRGSERESVGLERQTLYKYVYISTLEQGIWWLEWLFYSAPKAPIWRYNVGAKFRSVIPLWW